MFKLLISFKTVFLSMQEKLKLEAWWNKCYIDIILGWFLYFKTAFRAGLLMIWWRLSFTSSLGISKFWTILKEKLLRKFVTSALSETSFSFSIKVVFSLDFVFSDKKAFIVSKNILSSVIFFTLRLFYIEIFYIVGNSISCCWNFKSLFLNFVLSIIALEIALFLNGSLFPRTYFFLGGAYLFRTSVQTL